MKIVKQQPIFCFHRWQFGAWPTGPGIIQTGLRCLGCSVVWAPPMTPDGRPLQNAEAPKVQIGFIETEIPTLATEPQRVIKKDDDTKEVTP